MSWNVLRCIFVGLLIFSVDASFYGQEQTQEQQQQQQQHVSFDGSSEDLGQQKLIEQDNDKDALDNSVFGVLNALLTQVQEINRRGQKVELSKLDVCQSREGKEKLVVQSDAYKHLLNITETLIEEVQQIKRGQGEGCNRKCRTLQQQEPTSDLVKQVDCLRRGANLEMKRLVSGTYYFDKTTKMNFYEVENFCQQHGLQLATVDTLGKAKEVFSAGTVPSQGYWVAANDINQSSGDYRWTINGKKIHPEMWYNTAPYFSPTRFRVGQETCIVLWGNLLWDFPCAVKDRYVLCEMPKDCHEILKFA
ncbi:uncharacterized protein LOC135940680 isoform X1 [Cloeon dipterum]|uniref:uncharacterized protein LOC135940680 isoform X1 n=1 Tax=Cloeon dipterum TaxID=197152 RepID=UPI00321F9854